ncbi:MAG: NHL domain-containing protein, partial [Gammaproteobacteria bacterium]
MQWTVNGNPLAVSCEPRAEGATCTPTGGLPEGLNTLQASIADFHGQRGQSTAIPFTVDTRSPEIALDVPPEWITNQADQTLSGRLSETAVLTLDGATLPLRPDLSFSHRITLSEGPQLYTFRASDAAGHTGTASTRITLDTLAPLAPVPDRVSIGDPAGGSVTVTGGPGSVEPYAEVTITNTRTGESVTVTAESDGSFRTVIAAEAGDVLHIEAADPAGNHGEYRPFTVDVPGGDLPPDPGTVAPPLDDTGITPMHEATAFLYTGANSIQSGVAEGTIVPRRAAVIRGKVLSRDNKPLSGATITIKDHPEFGATMSRADGTLDMAVNGGGLLTVTYEKAGYLPAHRQIQTPWQDFAIVEDVVMVSLDARVTTIDLSHASQMQLAQGSMTTDADGIRQATVLFPQGTQATMILPDGSTQPLSSLHVRATEYTVGANGPKAMPGPLPPASGYTYAVELSVDEAIAAGAKRIDFNQPLPLYVDNFLDFPVGGIVPVGWYDRDKGAWIPSNNGRVIKILSTSGGIAGLDTDGDTLADDAAKLAALGITEAELTRLASLYPAGKTLWRSPITHFTPWDCNWPYGPPPGAGGPNGEPPEGDNSPDSDDSDDCPGCRIEAQSQTLGEEIPITGTPFNLHYRSDRVPGRTSANTLKIPLSGATVPNNLKDIVLKIELAGRTFEQHFPAQANSTRTFTWDGRDPYGRPVAGRRTARIRIGYTYQAVYYPPAQFAQSFAMPSGGGGSGGGGGSAIAITGDRARQEITLWRDSQVTVGSGGIQPALAGWSLSVHHLYDASGGGLYSGDGAKRGGASVLNSITTVAGSGPGFAGDGGPATAARFDSPRGVAVAPDGSFYIADSFNHRIRRVGPDGVITTVAGIGVGGGGFAGDGGPATTARLFTPSGVAVAADGSLYIADYVNDRIRRVGPDGVITTVAGNPHRPVIGDGGPATAARLDAPTGVAVAPDGSFYIADSFNHRIRRVGPDGVISTVAGTGSIGFGGDGGSATAAKLGLPTGVALAPDGSLYVADGGRIRRVGADGIITTVAGRDSGGFAPDGDGGPATAARFRSITGIARAADGSLYIADEGGPIRRVGSDGIITTVAGNGPATAANIGSASGVALAPDGSLYIVAGGRIRRVSWFLPGLAIASPDGAEVHVFDPTGRHLRTVDSFTNTVLYSFTYDGNGHLSAITDRDSDITRVERDATGDSTAIVSPDGQRTELVLTAEGYLASVTNPANETYRLDYWAGGLLKTVTDPKGHGDHFVYDAAGRLVRNTNAGHGGWTIARTEEARGYTASMTSAEGRTSSFQVEPLAIGDRRQVNTAPDGSVQTKLFKTNGEETTAAPDGTVTTVLEGPDPRFGMQAPLPRSATVKTPGGLASMVQTASLADPNDPLTLTALRDTVTVNGKAYQRTYEASARTWTRTTPAGRLSTIETDAKGRPVVNQV